MKYSFNTKRFGLLFGSGRHSIKEVMRRTGKTSNVTVTQWINGGYIRGEDIVTICNAFDINPAEFFLKDGMPIMAPQHNSHTEESENRSAQQLLHQQQLDFITEKAEIEKAHIKALMQKEVDLARRESDIREAARKELREEYEEQIRDLRNQLIDLTTQYRELEILGGRGPVTAVAECKGSNYINAKK